MGQERKSGRMITNHIEIKHKMENNIDIKENYINEFDSINDAANSLHILACNISNCLKGRQKSTPKGLYTWKYKF